MFSQEWPLARDLILGLRARFPDAVLIAGGEHVTAAGEYSLRDCRAIDYAVVGEGDETLVELLETLEAGGDVADVDGIIHLEGEAMVRTKPRRRLRNVDELPRPAWDLVPIEAYLANGLNHGVSSGRTMPLLATRGCPYSCTFCSNPGMWTTRWYARSPLEVADEMESYVKEYKADNFDFYDLTAIVKKAWIVEFCQELIRRKLDITWQLPAGTRSEAIDDDVTPLLARAGHRNLVYAPESGSPRVLKAIKKRVDLSRMLESMRSACRNSLSIKLNLIIGLPMETRRDIFATYWLMAKAAWIGVDDAMLSTFIPYPGSRLFAELQECGRIEQLSDDFFYDLSSEGSVGHVESYSAHVGPRALLAYKLFGMLLFYSLSHLFHPTRIFRTIWNVHRNEHETRLEKALGTLYLNFRRHRRFSV
jgi:radical SAM superfamily enzyme YgiQ (UPF0313 family)